MPSTIYYDTANLIRLCISTLEEHEASVSFLRQKLERMD